MKRILTALVLIPLVLLLVFKAPLWAIALVTCLVAVLATHEYLAIVEAYGVKPFRAIAYGLLVLLFVLSFFSASLDSLAGSRTVDVGGSRMLVLVFAVFVAAPFLCLVAGMRGELRDSLPASALSVFPVLYIGLSLATLIFFRAQDDGVFWIVTLFAAVWAGDSVAMYVGKSVGRHKLAPRISPGKTWEGSAGSLIGSLVFCLGAYAIRATILHYGTHRHTRELPDIALPIFVFVVIILNLAGQLGDLAESVIKRGANVKDSGTLLPGHGGILDRIDALLFAAPVLWYYLAIFRS